MDLRNCQNWLQYSDEIAKERKQRTDSVAEWTWANYAQEAYRRMESLSEWLKVYLLIGMTIQAIVIDDVH